MSLPFRSRVTKFFIHVISDSSFRNTGFICVNKSKILLVKNLMLIYEHINVYIRD